MYSRERLVDELWSDNFEGELRAVDTHIRRIRVKLGEWGAEHIITVYGTGYKIE